MPILHDSLWLPIVRYSYYVVESLWTSQFRGETFCYCCYITRKSQCAQGQNVGKSWSWVVQPTPVSGLKELCNIVYLCSGQSKPLPQRNYLRDSEQQAMCVLWSTLFYVQYGNRSMLSVDNWSVQVRVMKIFRTKDFVYTFDVCFNFLSVVNDNA